MNDQPMDDFEAYRQDRNYRRRQQLTMERPGGSNPVWEELQRAEEGELQDKILTREVHEFFSDATKHAADIVQRVSEMHQEALTDRLRREMEEFLRTTIQHANRFMEYITPGELAEQVLEPDIHRLLGRQLDSFRNEGTARLSDKHIGQDPFATSLETDVQGPQPKSESGQIENDKEPQPDARIALDDGVASETQEGPQFAPGFVDGSGEERPSLEVEAEKEVAQLAAAAEAARLAAEQAEQDRVAQIKQARMEREEKLKLRDALITMVKQGVMSKDRAQEVWKERLAEFKAK